LPCMEYLVATIGISSALRIPSCPSLKTDQRRSGGHQRSNVQRHTDSPLLMGVI
jgi:hypothetical protein